MLGPQLPGWLQLLNHNGTQVLLNENNTLALDGAQATFDNSTLRLVKHNWLAVKNGSLLALNDSRLNMTDFFTWWGAHSPLPALVHASHCCSRAHKTTPGLACCGAVACWRQPLPHTVVAGTCPTHPSLPATQSWRRGTC